MTDSAAGFGKWPRNCTTATSPTRLATLLYRIWRRTN